MQCGESNHGFCLLFHTPCTDQVLFPISKDYIFHNKSSITFPLAQGRQAYWAASLPCLCFPPRDLGFDHVLGLPESCNHSSRDLSLLISQGWPSLWLTHVWSARSSPTRPGFILAHHGTTHLHLLFFFSLSLYIYIFQCKVNSLLKSTCGKAHRWTQSYTPSLQSFNLHPLVPWSFPCYLNFLI